MILVSDGKETCKGDPCAVAKALRAAGTQVEVNVIGFDVTAAERKQLECVAEGGGGKYYNAATAKELQLAAAEVKQQVVQAPAPAAAVATGAAFRDDFEGAKLNPAWKIVKEDKNRWTQEGGKLLIVAPIFAKEIDAQVNRIEWDGSREVTLDGGTKVDLIGAKSSPENVWLRLEKQANTFTASFSLDGKRFIKIGDHTMLRMGGARLSLAASNLQAGGAEVSAEFDYVDIKPAP